MAKPDFSPLGTLDRPLRKLAGQCASLATYAFCVVVTALAMLQQSPFAAAQTSGNGNFKAAPKPESAENVEDAAAGLDYIMGIHVNTLFFIVAALIGTYWFTMGGGRKPRVSRDSS